MNIQRFIRQHREALDDYIRRKVPNIGKLNNAERRLWILNDEGLYRWAQSEGGRDADRWD